MEKHNDDVSYYLRQALMTERKRGTPDIRQLTDDLGYSTSLLYKIIEGERSLALEDFPRLYRFTKGALFPLLCHIVRQCDPQLTLSSMDCIGTPNGTVSDETEGIMIALGKFVDDNRDALRDGQYDEVERAVLEADLNKIAGLVETARAEIRAKGEK